MSIYRYAMLSSPSSRILAYGLFSAMTPRLLAAFSPLRSLSTGPPTIPTTLETHLHNSLLAGTSLNAAEQIQIVDTLTNVPLHGESRALMRLNKLCHRATYIFLKRPSDNKLFVQKRSPIKDYCPNYLDPTPGGVVGVGESYADNVVRELGEEMGLSSADVALKRLFTFKYEDDRVDCWGDAWEGEWEGAWEVAREGAWAPLLHGSAEERRETSAALARCIPWTPFPGTGRLCRPSILCNSAPAPG